MSEVTDFADFSKKNKKLNYGADILWPLTCNRKILKFISLMTDNI